MHHLCTNLDLMPPLSIKMYVFSNFIFVLLPNPIKSMISYRGLVNIKQNAKILSIIMSLSKTTSSD